MQVVSFNKLRYRAFCITHDLIKKFAAKVDILVKYGPL